MVMLSQIDAAVCEKYRITLTALKGDSQERRIARPRQVAYYMARTITKHSLPELGLWYGGRDHTTVMHGFRKIERLMAESPLFAVEMADLKEQIAQAPPSPLVLAARRFAMRKAQNTIDLQATG